MSVDNSKAICFVCGGDLVPTIVDAGPIPDNSLRESGYLSPSLWKCLDCNRKFEKNERTGTFKLYRDCGDQGLV